MYGKRKYSRYISYTILQVTRNEVGAAGANGTWPHGHQVQARQLQATRQYDSGCGLQLGPGRLDPHDCQGMSSSPAEMPAKLIVSQSKDVSLDKSF